MKIRTLVETTACDVCAAPVNGGADLRVGLGSSQWDVDLCDDHLDELESVVAQWTRAGRAVAKARSRAAASADWDYLETQGFSRHRGRKTAAEQAALDGR